MGDYYNIKERFKEFLKQSIPKKIITILVILSIVLYTFLIVYSMIVLSTFSLKSIYLDYMTSLGFDYKSPLNYFLMLMTPLIIISGIFYFLGKINWSVVSAITLIIFLIIFGLSFINESYKKIFP